METQSNTNEIKNIQEDLHIKPKRKLTDAQLAALKKGRDKLAEKRKIAKHLIEEEEAIENEMKKENDSEEDCSFFIYIIYFIFIYNLFF